MPGCFAAVNLFPETESAIVVLTKTTPLYDLTDWMTQLLTQTLFDFPEKVDIVSWVKRTAEAELKWHARMTVEMKRKQDPAPPMRKIEEYVGTFVNEAHTSFVEIVQRGDELLFVFESREDELFNMTHLNGDTLLWLQIEMTRSVEAGWFCSQPRTI